MKCNNLVFILWCSSVFLITISCSKSGYQDLKLVKDDKFLRVYEASFDYPYSITLNTEFNRLISQKIMASDLEFVQNINGYHTVAVQVSTPKFCIVANVDTLGNITSMSVWDGHKQHLLHWNDGKMQ